MLVNVMGHPEKNGVFNLQLKTYKTDSFLINWISREVRVRAKKNIDS